MSILRPLNVRNAIHKSQPLNQISPAHTFQHTLCGI